MKPLRHLVTPRATALGVIATVLVVAACAHDEHKTAVIAGVAGAGGGHSAAPAAPPQYLVADPIADGSGAAPVALGTAGAYGVVVDKRRVVIGQGDSRVAKETPSEHILGASRIPARFASGFVFWTQRAIYRADAFDGSLLPVAQLDDVIDSVSFAPKSLLVHTKNGERWGIALPSGERVAIAPLGVADVQALDDGRALAFTDQGAVYTSLDHGAHYQDVTAQVKNPPERLALIADDLWLVDSAGGSWRLERDGRLSSFDKVPDETRAEVRPKDPRWHGTLAPLRTVFHTGASVDDTTGVVLEGGDLVRVDLRTGEIVSMVQGRLPPDSECEAVPVSGDVLFVCAARNGSGVFVVSHTLSFDSPQIEQTFPSGSQIYASDDGGLVYAGACTAAPSPNPSASSLPAACVRMPGGRWEDRDVSGLVVDGGVPSDVHVARWIPRADGRLVALVADPTVGIYEPATGSFTTLVPDAREVVGHVSPAFSIMKGKIRRGGSSSLVDGSWSFGTGNTLRGWQRHAESVEIGDDGKLIRSPFALDVVFSGAYGLGRSKEGRLYQSSDHGASWVEIAAPPSGIEAADLLACSTAGCDLGAFYRIGWAERAPLPDPPKGVVRPAPGARRVRGLELACRPLGSVSTKVIPHTGSSPEDLGLGARRIGVADEKTDFSYVRNVVARTVVSPVHDYTEGGDGLPSLRAVFSGYGTNRDGDLMTVNGPNKNVYALRRTFTWAPPFDLQGRIVQTGIALSEIVAAGKRGGQTVDEILSDDPTETGSVAMLTPADPSASADVAIHNAERGFVTIVRGERTRVAYHPSQSSGIVVSGVSLGGPGDETALHEVDPHGIGRVFKIGAAGASDLFDVNPAGTDALYPANPDALAVGPKGELAVIRVPSGSEPPSLLDPPYLIAPALPPSQLGPWSEVKWADDPACKAEPGGFRATIQAIGPWVRVTTPELRVLDDGPMLARVRWTAKRPCLEAFEVKLPYVTVHSSGVGAEPLSVATWLVAKNGTYARVGVSEGIEWRQGLECSVVATAP